MATLAIVPAPVTSRPLYEIEESLAALLETAELVTPEQEEEFQAVLEGALTTAIEKRDRVGHFFSHLENQISFAKSEIKRIQERKGAYERVLDRMEEYIVRIIEERGTPNLKGKMSYPKLEGKTVTFSIRGCPASVLITNEQAIPASFKSLTITMPATIWDRVLGQLTDDERIQALAGVRDSDVAVNKKAVKAAIEAGELVPGADLAIGNHSLVRK